MTRGQTIVYLDAEHRAYLDRRRRKHHTPASETVREAIDLHRRINEGAKSGDGKLGAALSQMIDKMSPREVRLISKVVWATIEAVRDAEADRVKRGSGSADLPDWEEVRDGVNSYRRPRRWGSETIHQERGIDSKGGDKKP